MIFLNNISRFFENRNLKLLTISTLTVILIGTVFYHFIEGLGWIDAFYFSVVTLTTVGYGDFAPETYVGKLFTAVYILTGIGIIFGFINAVYQHQVENVKERERRKMNKKPRRD